MDEGTDYRIHITPIADGEKAVLHYRYAAVVGCKAGQLVLRMPENLEENPVPAEVTVTLAPSPDGLALAEASLEPGRRDSAGARARWSCREPRRRGQPGRSRGAMPERQEASRGKSWPPPRRFHASIPAEGRPKNGPAI
jgi:hypothetical protein